MWRLGVGGVLFWLWVGLLSPRSRLFQMLPPRSSAAAKMPGEERLGGVSAHLHPPERPTSAGRAGKRPLLGFLFSHRYTPSRRAPHFLYNSITPKGCLKDTLTGFPPAFLPSPAAPTAGATLPCALPIACCSRLQILQGCNLLLTLSRYNL